MCWALDLAFNLFIRLMDCSANFIVTFRQSWSDLLHKPHGVCCQTIFWALLSISAFCTSRMAQKLSKPLMWFFVTFVVGTWLNFIKFHFKHINFLTARCYASAVYAVALCLSIYWFVTSDAKYLWEIRLGLPVIPMGARNTGGVGR